MPSETQRAGPAAAFAARILDAAGEVVGAGFVVGPRQIATCAHVVSAVLGGSPEDPEAPTGRVRVDIPLLAPPHASDAVVGIWRAIDPATGGGDVAILELDGTPVGARLPPLYRPDRLWGHRFRVLGFPSGMQDGVWVAGELRERQGTRWLQLERDPHGPPIAQGFSGAPVWDEEVEAVVGMTVASDLRPGGTTAYLLPIEDVLGVDPRLLPNPYRGLEPFGEEHADVFYGREDEVDRLEALLDRQPIVAVVGRSGTGKSSLVRAGLLPRMRRRGVGIIELRPGPAESADEVPAALDRLLGALDRPAPGEQDPGRLVFADQFEELVGAVPTRAGPTPAQQVLRQLVDEVRAAPALPDGAPSLRVVLTLRWEAMNELLTDDVVETFEEGTFSLAAMSRSQLRLAIVGPTARAPGLDFEPGLVERILDDAVAEPGQLPLVESLLAQLWESRQSGTLTSAAYDRLGGVTGAIARHAEQAIGEITTTGDAGLRRLLTALARPDDGTGFVRRPAKFEGLPSDQQRVVESLARSRLLVVGQKADGDRTIELAHQALIDHWPRLRGWLDADREFLLWQHEVDRQRQDWERIGHDRDVLLRGAALARATEWQDRRGDDLPPPTRAFLDASRERERRELRRHRTLQSAGAIVVALVLVLATAAVDQRRDARREAARSASRSLATLSSDTADADPALSMMQALAAYEHHPTPEAERALFRLYAEYRDIDAVLTGAQGAITYSVASREAEVIAAMTALDRVTVWVRRPGQPVAVQQLERPRNGGRVASVAVSPSGHGVLVVETTRAWYHDVASGERRWELPVDGDAEVAWLRDDGTVLLSLRAGNFDRLEVWEPRGDRARRVAELTTPPGVRAGVHGFGPGPDTVVLSAVDYNASDLESVDSRLQLWDTTTGELTTVADDGTPTLGPDGRLVAMCHYTAEDDTLGLIDLRDSSERTFDLPQGVDCTTTTAISAGNDVVVTANGHLLLDLRSEEATVQPSPLDDEPPFLVTAVWKEGDRHLILAHDQTRLIVRELATDDELIRGMPGASEGATDVAAARGPLQLTPDGEHVVAVLDRGRTLAVSPTTARGIDFPIAARTDRPAPHREPSVLDLAISPDSSLVADRVADDRVQVRRLPDLDLVSEITTAPVTDEARVTSFVEFTGGRLLTSDGTRLEWWNPDTGAAIDALDLAATGTVPAADAGRVTITPLPEPSRLALADPERDDVRIISADTGRVVDTIPAGRDVLEVRFQGDSPYLALHRRGGLMEIWDADQHRRVVGPVTVPEPREGDPFALSPSVVLGQFLAEPGSFLLAVGATGAQGAQLRWYQVGTGPPERTLDLGGATDLLASGPQPLWFSADGDVVLFAIAPASASLLPASQPLTLNLRPEAWQDAICGWIGGRRFTDAELATLPDGTESLILC